MREVLAACDAAVAGLAASDPDVIVVVGGADRPGCYDGTAAGSLRPFGVPYSVGSGAPVLPLSLTIGSWLLRRGGQVAARLHAVPWDTPAADCLRQGATLARQAPRAAMLVMGDGSARRAVGVPGTPDPAAERYDADVAAALAVADPARLSRLDPALDAELVVAGRAAWQVLAGAAIGAHLVGMLRCVAAPHGVSYLVASWDTPG